MPLRSNSVRLGSLLRTVSRGALALAAPFSAPSAPLPAADYVVTNDAQLASAILAATSGQIIQLANAGTFTAQANINNKTGITLRGETYSVPFLQAGLTATGTTNCKVLGLLIERLAPNSTASYDAFGVVEGANAGGLEIAGCEIRSNPLAGIAMQAGTSGSLFFQGYRGINAANAAAFNIHDNYIHDTFRGISIQVAAGSTGTIQKNRIIDHYQNPCEMAGLTGGRIDFIHNDCMGTWAISTDPGSPHSSTLGFGAAAVWTPFVVGNILIAGVGRRFAAKGTYAAASGPKFNDPTPGTAMNYLNGVFAFNLCTAQDGIGLEASFGNFAIFCNTVVKDELAGSTLSPGFNYHDIGAGSYARKNVFCGFQLNSSNVNGVHADFIANSFDNVMLLPAGLGSPAVASGDLNCYDFHFDGPSFSGWTIENIVARLTPKAGSFLALDGIGAIGTGYNWTTRTYPSLPSFTKPKTTNASGTAPALTQFDGTNDWLQLSGAAPLLGLTNRRALTIAMHFGYTGADATDCFPAESVGTDYTVRKLGITGRMRYRAKNAGNVAICEVDSSQLFTQLAADAASPDKRLWLFTANFTTGRVFIMRGKELDPFPTVTILKPDDLANTRSQHAIMGQNDTTPPAGTGLTAGQLGLFYMTDEFINLGIAANHNSIVATDGSPADWGANGSGLSGTQPRGFVKGNAAALNAAGGINLGSSAQKWVMTGAVTDV